MGFWQRLVYGRKNRFSEAEARSYIETILRDRRRLFTGAYRLERFSDGTDQGVYRLEYDGAPPRVIRFHRLRRDERAEHFFRVHEYLGRLGLPIPAILYADRSPEVKRRWGVEVSLEQWIEGTHFDGPCREDPAVVRRLAQLLARFHAVKSPAHGLPWKPVHRPPYGVVLMNRIRHCYARIVKTSGLVDRTEAGRHVAWFERWCQRLGAIAEYNLLHGDLHGQNVIIAPDGKVHALDFIATHFGYFERDLAVCARTLVARSSFRHELFFAEYFRIAGPDAARRYQAHQPFFTAQVCLEMVYSSTVKAWRIDRGLKHQTGPYASEAKKFLEILRQTIEASPDPAAGA